MDVYVVTCNEVRKAFMKEQLDSMKISATYFHACTPETSKDWLSPDPRVIDKLQCCLRTHIEALYSWLQSSSNPYILILEDDVCLLKEDFQLKLDNVVSLYEKHKDIDYVSIGYLPVTLGGSPLSEKLVGRKQDETMYWDFDNAGYTVWGTQAQLFRRDVAQKIVNLLRQDTATKIVEVVKEHVKTHKTFQNKEIHPTADALLPFLFSQAIVCSPLAIEQYTPSTIFSADGLESRYGNWRKAEAAGMFRFTDFYSL